MLGSVFSTGEVTPPGFITCVDIEDLDITSSKQINTMFSDINPNLVINCSAYTNVDGAETEPDKSAAINVHGVANLAKACKRSDAVLVHYSTDFIFDGKSSTPYKEDHPPAPLSVYGRTKLDGEQAIREILDESSYLIIRTSWLFGPRGKNFVTTIISAAQQNKPLNIVTDQCGKPTYTRDLAAATLSLLTHEARGVFHVSNEGSCSWYDFARYALDCAGMTDYPTGTMTSDQLNRPAQRPAYSLLDTSKFNDCCGYRLRHWHQAVEEFVNHYMLAEN